MRSWFALTVAVLPACVVTSLPVSPPTTTAASASASAVVEIEPPPPQAEVVEARPGYVFIAGRWTWQNGGWVWIPGHWERERVGSVWAPGRWENQGRGWVWIEGSWVAAVGTSAPPPPTTPVATTTNPKAVAMLALGEGSTCSLSVAGRIRCWGYNHHGALGVGSRETSADGYVTGIDEEVRAIDAGDHQQCALTASGHVWCWGLNIEGQVGNGSTAPSEQPVLKPTRVAIDDVRSLHLGNKTSCVLTRESHLYCWGANGHHQIDDSSTKRITQPTQVSGTGRVDLVAVGSYHICYVVDGRAQCRGHVAPLNADVAALKNVTAISAGYGHSCAIHDGGRLSCWGNAYIGVLGQGNQCPVQDGTGECVSKMRPPALVPGIDANPVEVATHTYHTCVRFSSGSVTCFGNNQGGAFSDSLPKEPWQTAHVLPGVVADAVYVGGVHVCTVRGGVATCRGNDGNGAVRGAR